MSEIGMLADLTSTTVLVLNFNGRQHLDDCLSSLGSMDVFVPGRPGIVREGTSPVNVWLVDNGSVDGSIEHVARHHPWVRVVANESNLGFSRAYNRAAGLCETRWIAFLNNDTRVTTHWISALHAAAQRHPDAAAVVSRIMSWDEERIDFVGADTYFTGHALQHEVGAPAGRRRFAERPVLFGCAGALMFRRDLFLELGGFDPAYFSFFEDVDLGWRAALMGHETWFAPDAVVRHRLHATWGGGVSSRSRYLVERNALFTIFKNYSDARMGVIVLTSAALTFMRALHASPTLNLLASPRVSGDTLAHLLAVAGLLSFGGELRDRRHNVQAGRCRDDGEILDLFGEVDSPPFSVGERFRPAYNRTCRPAHHGKPGWIGSWAPEVNRLAEEAAFLLAHVCANAVAQRYPVRRFLAEAPPLDAERPLSTGGARMLNEARDALVRFLDGEPTVPSIDELRTTLEGIRRIEPHEGLGVPPSLLPGWPAKIEDAAPLVQRQPLDPAPLLSVVIRTRDRLDRLRRALASVAAQRYPRLEVVVINDGGKDPTGLLTEFEHAFSSRLITNPTSLGRSRAAQVGLESAAGDYVNFLDDDDVLLPDHLHTLAEAVARENVRVAYTNVECLLVGAEQDRDENVLARSVFASEFDPVRLLFENTIPIMAVLMERKLALAVGGFDPALEYFEDWDLWLRLSRQTAFFHVPMVTATYFVSQAPRRTSSVADDPRWPYLAMIFEKHRDLIHGEGWASYYRDYIEPARARLSEIEAREADCEALLAKEAAQRRAIEQSRSWRALQLLRRWSGRR
ncbi:MAG: glycosyltransferase family 2 protein [Thermoanaerobaculaceae bacterium]